MRAELMTAAYLRMVAIRVEAAHWEAHGKGVWNSQKFHTR
jgi:hypothetical protein